VRIAAALGLAACVLAAGCGGASKSSEGPRSGTLEALWRAPGEDVGIVAGTSDYAPGSVRVAFLVVDGQGQVISRPTAKLWLARGLKQEPFATGTAELERIGVPGGDTADASDIYIAHLDLPKPGKYWLLAEPVGGQEKIQAIGNVVVKAKAEAPVPGDPAPRSDTPTLADAKLDVLTTSKTPDPELYRSSIADAVAARAPFVVVFATPKFCTSRTCGPVVDVVSAVRKRLAEPELRFIHVEIYKDNDPTKGVNRFVTEWKLPSEPWVFLVGADGKVVDRFEGTVSARELEAAVRTKLLP
jgi:hypothetical protein